MSDSPDTPKHTVLYIEDSPANLALMEQYFELFDDIDLILATTAEDGLVSAAEHLPEVILMDIHLPGMSGLEALAELRKSQTTRDIPVIAISADAMPDDVRHALDQGFNAYLTKPLKLQQLEDLVYGHLNRK